VKPENLRLHEHGPDELAHYAKKAMDIQYNVPFGWKELEGIHNRTDFDLGRHQEYSGKRLEYVDSASGKRFVPYVVETAVGVDRTALMLLCDAYREEEVEGEVRVVLGFQPQMAPIKAAVFPLMRKDGHPEMARKIVNELRAAAIPVFYDDAGSIGRRYRRQDETGTPWCITVDGESIENGTVTIRDRDTLEQVRVEASRIREWIATALAR
jgi:glycyl-tRNA synthetase